MGSMSQDEVNAGLFDECKKLQADNAELEAELSKEKKTRVDYQGIVYGLCNDLDRRLGREVSKGRGTTVEALREDMAIYIDLLLCKADAKEAENAKMRSGEAFVGEEIKAGDDRPPFYWHSAVGADCQLMVRPSPVSIVPERLHEQWFRYTGPTTAPLPSEPPCSEVQTSGAALTESPESCKAHAPPKDATPLPDWLAKGVRVRIHNGSESWVFLGGDSIWRLTNGDWIAACMACDCEVIPNPNNDKELAARLKEK